MLGESDSSSGSVATTELGQNKGGGLLIIASLISDSLVGSINLIWYINALSFSNHDISSDDNEPKKDSSEAPKLVYHFGFQNKAKMNKSQEKAVSATTGINGSSCLPLIRP